MSTFASETILKKIFFLIFFAAVSFLLFQKKENIFLWAAIQKNPPEWAASQLFSDFSPFTSITQEALDETHQKIAKTNASVVRYRLIDGRIFRLAGSSSERTRQFEKILRRIGKAKKIPNIDFLVCLSDGVPESYHPKDFWLTKNQAPLLAWAKLKWAPFVVLIPDFLTTKEASWHKLIEEINEVYTSFPWEKREGKAFWRGASNDKEYTLENYRTRPRYIISEISSRRPDFVDAGFCRIYPEDVAQALKDLIVPNASLKEHAIYKYLPVLDGFMCTFPGFQWRLLSGSLTLKQESDEIQYFYSALKPNVHYIPIKNDMSDLLEKIEWAKDHDLECRTIAENARKFALENLMPNQIYAYLYWTLKRYAKLQTFDLNLSSLGPEWQEQVR